MSAVNELVITPEFVTNIIAVDLADETTFTTADKAKLNGIEAGAQVNTVTRVAGKTGVVELDAGDIAYDASETYASGKIGAALKSAEEKLNTINAGDIGYDGSTAYDTGTVGEELTHLNRQISELDSAITRQIHTEITNLGDGYINSTNGEIKTPTGDIQKYTVDFIPVAFGERIIGTLTLSASRYRSIGIFGYDADKNFLGRLAVIDGSVSDEIALDHTIANEAVAFVRYSFSTYGVLSGFSVDAYVSNTQMITAINNTVETKTLPLLSLEGIGYQFLDNTKFALGYYNWKSGQTDIQKNSATQNWYCMVIPELAAGTYHYNKFFNTNFSFIRNLTTNAVQKMTDAGFSDTANGTITIAYPFTLYITCHDQLQDMTNGMISNGDLPLEYTYGYYKVPKWDVNAQGQTTWIVGNGYIPTIQEACNRASANDIIFIKCGTYTEQVSIWNKKLHLIGEDKANTKLIDHSGAYNTPPLEMSLGSLSNMTIIEDGSDPTLQPGESGYNAAYCLHIEWTPPANEVFYINNCDFINYVHSPLGCGLYQDYTVHFKDCTFRCEATNEGNMERGSFYFHTNVNPNVTGQKIIAENCIISSAGQRWAVLLGVPSGANNTGSGEARFSGCTIWNDNVGTADSIAYFDTSGGADVLKVVHSCGNTVEILNNW